MEAKNKRDSSRKHRATRSVGSTLQGLKPDSFATTYVAAEAATS